MPMTNTTKMPWLKTERTGPTESTDRITDQSLTVRECRTLLEIIHIVEPGLNGWNTEYKKMLYRLKQKAKRGAAMETPKETQERYQND
tara:strand:- start:421 stop:684 length:264 start_codon:yes stop_codon:yes gene_type:complete